jgi:uncharacterized protein (DUF433 family)
METLTAYKYIVKKENTGEPVVQGTRVSERDIVEHWKMGAAPEEITSVYPHISHSQIFEALTYYHDNKGEVERFIEKNKVPESLSGTALSR